MELQDLIQDVIANAPVDRAGNWLIEASREFPDLFAAITEHLNEPPSVVLAHLVQAYPLAAGLYLVPSAQGWISNLQSFFREKLHGSN